MRKNEENIRKVRMSLENTIDKEIKDRIRLEREMLAGTVTVQNSILGAIRARYQNEWAIMKKDIEKKKQALSEEKSLINERLNARKNAANEANKYEQLAELQRQLALISGDTTRTKDVKELRKQISDLQEELSWDIATQETETATKMIDDQMKALDEYATVYEEDLNEMLKNSNNFLGEIEAVMGGSFDTYVEYMRQNDEAYINSTAEARKQMEQGWSDTWDKMKGFVRTYWEEVDATMRSKDGFLEYMMKSQDYINASETGQKSLIASWEDLYDAYERSLIDTADWDHSHEIVDKLDKLKDYTYSVELAKAAPGSEEYISLLHLMYANNDSLSPDAMNYNPNDQYSNVYGSTVSDFASKHTEDLKTVPSYNGGSGSGGSGGTGGTPKPKVDPAKTGDGKRYSVKWTAGTNSYIAMRLPLDANGRAQGQYETLAEAKLAAAQMNVTDYSKSAQMHPLTTTKGESTISDYLLKRSLNMAKYAEGGLVDYTGPAWVDGTKTRPESFLDAVDTENIRALTNALNYINLGSPLRPLN